MLQAIFINIKKSTKQTKIYTSVECLSFTFVLLTGAVAPGKFNIKKKT